MKLRSKASLIIAGIWVFIGLAVFLDSKLFLIKNFNEQEHKLAIKDMDRVRNALTNQMQALALYTNSWSQWDDAYDFMKNKSAKFIESNFVPGTYTSSSLNFFLFYNTGGTYYYGQSYDLKTDKMSPIPTSLIKTLNSNKTFVTHTNGADLKRSGIFKIPEGIVVLSSLPVLDSDGKATPDGTLLMGYYLRGKHITNISDTVELRTTLHTLPIANDNSSLKSAYEKLLTNDHYIESNNPNILTGFTLVRDINNEPVALIEVEIPRVLYNEGITAIQHHLFILIAIGLVMLATLWYLLKSLVLNRILKISDQVVQINMAGDFKKRIKVTGDDELTSMAASINSMLTLIEQIQEQLKHRIDRRTKDLAKASKLNRNLHSEMGKQKSMEEKLKEDQKELRKMAYYDTLTNLPNRACFSELLTKALEQATDKKKIAVIFVDIDKFKKINDTYGHDFGDRFLKEIAARLKKSINDHDVAARLAGDEFILFLNSVGDKKMIDDAIENIFQHVTALVNIDGITLTPTFSMGVSISPDDGTTINELCHRADLAMYHAKKSEGNFYYYFDALKEDTSEPV